MFFLPETVVLILSKGSKLRCGYFYRSAKSLYIGLWSNMSLSRNPKFEYRNPKETRVEGRVSRGREILSPLVTHHSTLSSRRQRRAVSDHPHSSVVLRF